MLDQNPKSHRNPCRKPCTKRLSYMVYGMSHPTFIPNFILIPSSNRLVNPKP